MTTAVSSLLKLRLLVDEILTNPEDHYSTPTKSLDCALQGRFEMNDGQAIFGHWGACLRVHSATASSFEVISYFYELDIHISSRPVDSLFFLSRRFVFGIPISVKAVTRS